MNIARVTAVRFVVLMGIVSLFADFTYEGARSILGPYLKILGASATVVGIVAGTGELIGYGLRLVSGYLSDRTKRYWTITILGFVINLLAVPLLAFAGNWVAAAGLVIAERMGKAIRTPARDAMLSYANKQIGQGWGFGLHEALDQLGAVIGPLMIAYALSRNTSYSSAFLWLLIPALLGLTALAICRWQFPRPEELDIQSKLHGSKNFPRQFWVYCAGAAFVAMGYADFPLIAFHLETNQSASTIPLFYALAMGIDAVAALFFGWLYDRKGLSVLIFAFLLSCLFAPLIFLTNWILTGIILWGIGMGAQESILKASIAEMVVAEKRGSAYGVFHMIFGVSWFAGSVMLGYLYDTSLLWLAIISCGLQLLSIPLLFAVRSKVS